MTEFAGAPSAAEFFGCDDYDVFHAAKNAQETAEGYMAGTILARRIYKEILDSELEDKSRTYKESLLNALREQL